MFLVRLMAFGGVFLFFAKMGCLKKLSKIGLLFRIYM